MTNIIKENDLSLLILQKENPLKSWIIEKILKPEVSYYKLDEIYNQAAIVSPILRNDIKELKGNTTIEVGQDISFTVINDNFIVLLVEKINKAIRIH